MPGSLSFEDEIRTLLRRDPFHPFVLEVTSGDQYVVEDPFQVAMNESTIYIAHHRRAATVIRKNQLVSVEAPEPTE